MDLERFESTKISNDGERTNHELGEVIEGLAEDHVPMLG